MRQLIHSLSGDNNLVPFHLWWRQIVLKSEKVYKCFVQDCRLIISSSEGIDLFKKINISIRVYIICDIFAYKGHAVLGTQYDLMTFTGHQTLGTFYIFLWAMKLWWARFAFKIRFEFKKTSYKKKLLLQKRFLFLSLTLLWRSSLSYRNQSMDLRHRGFLHERVKGEWLATRVIYPESTTEQLLVPKDISTATNTVSYYIILMKLCCIIRRFTGCLSWKTDLKEYIGKDFVFLML